MNRWMTRNGLKFSRTDGIAGTFAALLPVIVTELLGLL